MCVCVCVCGVLCGVCVCVCVCVTSHAAMTDSCLSVCCGRYKMSEYECKYSCTFIISDALYCVHVCMWQGNIQRNDTVGNYFVCVCVCVCWCVRSFGKGSCCNIAVRRMIMLSVSV